MSDREGCQVLLEAARAVRAYVPDLIGAHEAAAVDARLADILAHSSDGDDVVADLVAFFAANDNLRDWVAFFLEHELPPDMVEEAERASRPPGDSQPLPPPIERFICPVGADFTRFRRLAHQDLGECPTHGVPLVPSSQDQ